MPRSEEFSPRVLAAIRQNDAASEVLLSWVQFGFLVFMTVLYFIAPKGFSKDVQFEPVPIMLALYAPFILCRLILTLRQRLTPFILSLSVLVDMAFILGLIYSFHLQYEQPLAFALKAPTFCYLFIFIVLRSLRYDLRYLLLAGIAAMVGWSGLVCLAIWQHGHITRSYIDYIVGNNILIGAEVDKILSLAAVTIILSIGISRARRMLSKSEAEALAKQELARFFSPDVAHKIIYSEERIKPGHGDLCHAVVLMMDLRGFTRLAKSIVPHEVMELLADYQARMVPFILAHGGCVDKFLGDGILAHFGAAAHSQTYAADALRAAEALYQSTLEWNAVRKEKGAQPIRIGVACAVGEMIFGAVGDNDRLEFTVIGDAVNLSAKLEKHTKVAGIEILATKELFDLALQQGYEAGFSVVDLPEETVEGVPQPMALVGLKPVHVGV